MFFRHVGNGAIDAAAHLLWRLPASFGVARMLGRSYGLRCVVFHDIADAQTPFTTGIRVTVSPKQFEAALKFLTTYYVPVSLQEVLSDGEGQGLPDRAVLVSFDDAYASVYEIAVPLCRKYGVPAAFFVNASALDNRRLLPDNLICSAASTIGIQKVQAAARTISGHDSITLHSLAEVFGRFLPSLLLAQREAFLDELRRLAKIDEARLAADAALYLTRRQLRDLHAANFEIGNHTYTHTHCRLLGRADLVAEISRNKAELEDISDRTVRAFSQPYGSLEDLVPEVIEHLKDSGHDAAFLSESVANIHGADAYHLDRVSVRSTGEEKLFADLEIKPRLRAIRNGCFSQASAESRQAAAFSTHRKDRGRGSEPPICVDNGGEKRA